MLSPFWFIFKNTVADFGAFLKILKKNKKFETSTSNEDVRLIVSLKIDEKWENII